MNIKLMLTRLQSALGSHDLVEQMVLLPSASQNADVAESKKLNGLPDVAPRTRPLQHKAMPVAAPANQNRKLNLVVGYNKTPGSQTALDLTLWIAHQTRLATREQVTVHIVYVAEPEGRYSDLDAITVSPSAHRFPLELFEDSTLRSTTPVSTKSTQLPEASSERPLTKAKHQILTACAQMTLIAPCFNTTSAQQFAESGSLASLSQAQTNTCEQADQILERAQSLAQEWGGAFKTHVRVGEVATELRKVVEREAATLLLLGCHSIDHPIVQQLGADFPCVVLGIPKGLNQADDGTMEV